MDPALWELVRAVPDADREIEAIIRLARPGIEIPGVRVVARFGTIATCRLPARAVTDVWAHEDVLSLKAARRVGPGGSAGASGALARGTDRRRPEGLDVTGAGVVIGSADWGLDVDAFRDADGGTRLLAFWDQRDQAPGPRSERYGYGVVHDRTAIDAALRTGDPYSALGYHPSIADRGGGAHGTHVLDIAAGNGGTGGPVGIAPEAELVFVHLADRATAGLANLGDSVRLLEAVDFIRRTAAGRPWVVNLSVGRHGGPHDGTTLVEQAFDELLAAEPGCLVSQSAGNYHCTRTHAGGIVVPGHPVVLDVVSDPRDTTPNELEVFYDGAAEFVVRIAPPGCPDGPTVALGERRDLLLDGRLIGRVYHRAREPNSHANHVDAFLDPVGLGGTWTVMLEARSPTGGRFDAWIERDDTCGHCQARFVARDSDQRITTGTIANGRLPVVVGAYDGHVPARDPARFSSAGPTRDGRGKPDLAAPGVAVLAARSAAAGSPRNDGELVRKSGTSMAAPHVAGAAALCLEIAGRRLTAAQLRDLVLGTADPVDTADPDRQLGRGYLDIPALLAAVRAAVAPTEGTESIMQSDPNPDALGLADSPAVVYREYLYRPRGELARWVDEHFTVVARPGRVPAQVPEPGDLVIDVPLGRGGAPGRCARIDVGEAAEFRRVRRTRHGRLVLRPLRAVVGTDPQPVDPAVPEPEPEPAPDDAPDELGRLVEQGLSENQITDTLYDARHADRAGVRLRAGTAAAREWTAIRDREVRPGLRTRLVPARVDPVSLAVFLSQYENDKRVPADVTRRFLTAPPLLSMGRSLRDRVLAHWRDGAAPLGTTAFFRLALDTAGDPGVAMLLCHSVAKAFVREGDAITWHGTGTEGSYTDGQHTYVARQIHPAGRLRYRRGDRDIVSVFYVLFSATEFGVDDPGDWYHFYVTATMAALGGTGGLDAIDRRESVDAEDRGDRIDKTVYRSLLADRIADLERQLSDPALTAAPGYRGWVLADALSFLEGGFYGKDYASDQSDVDRESAVHLRGAVFGLGAVGRRPGSAWRWRVPMAGSLSKLDLGVGFSIKGATAHIWTPEGRPSSGDGAEAATDDFLAELLGDADLSPDDVGDDAEFAGPEHKAIGDDGSGREETTIPYGNPPRPLSFGDVVATAGDYFDSYEQMRDLGQSEPGRAELELARWRALDLPAAAEPRATPEQQQRVTDRYYLLATRNLSHFSAGGTAWQAYTLGHGKAIADALDAGLNRDSGVWRRALTKDAFACHFLTDMFAGGHVRTPRADIRDWYDRHFPGADKLVAYLARYLFDRLDERQQLPSLLWWVGWLTRSVLGDRVRAMGGEAVQGFSLGSIVALALHNQDNKGLAVVSDVDPDGRPVAGGFAWTAVGDGHLSRSALGAQTKAMATAAVIASLRDLERVRGAGVARAGRPGTLTERTEAVRQALGTDGFAARRYVPRERPGANPDLVSTGGTRAPLEWRWGQLGDLACRAVDEAVRIDMAGELGRLAGRVPDPAEAPLGIRVHGTRAAFRSFVHHLKERGIGAIEDAVGTPAR